jgi:hypothetical protein
MPPAGRARCLPSVSYAGSESKITGGTAPGRIGARPTTSRRRHSSSALPMIRQPTTRASTPPHGWAIRCISRKAVRTICRISSPMSTPRLARLQMARRRPGSMPRCSNGTSGISLTRPSRAPTQAMSKERCTMSMPGFTSEASLYRTSNCYNMTVSTQQNYRTVQPSLLRTCAPGELCYSYETGYICNCPPGQTCARRCPVYCYTVCFLWWCWERCERSETCSSDMFCQ